MSSRKEERPRRKRWMRRAGVLVAVLVVLAGGALGALHTGWGKDLIRARAEAALGKRVNGSVSIGALDYEFPFANVKVTALEIRDAAGASAIAVESLGISVDLLSALSETLVVESLSVAGLVVNSHVAADGTNSLRGLFAENEGGAERPLSVREARISGMQLHLTKADGDTLSLREGLVVARIEKGASDTEIFLDEFGVKFVATRALATLAGEITQKGAVLRTNPQRTVVTLQPLNTTLHLSREDHPDVRTSIAFAGGEVELTPTALVATVGEIVLGPMAIEKATAKLGFERGQPSGPQSLQLSGLSIDTKVVGELVERPMPVGNATGEASIVGPPENLVVTALLHTAEGQVSLAGKIDITGKNGPKYDLSTTADIAVTAIPTLENTPLRIDSLVPTELRLRLSGEGMPSKGGSLVLALEGLQTTDGVTSETVRLRAHREGRSLHVDSLKLNILGTEVLAKGALDTSGNGGEMSATLTVKGNAKRALAELESLGLVVSPPLHLPSELFLDVELRGRADERITVNVRPSETAIAGGRVRLEGQAIFEPRADAMVLVSADGSMNLRGLSLRGLAHLARKPARARGRISGTVRLRQRGTRREVDHDIRVRLPDFGLEVQGKGRLGPSHWRGRVEVREPGATEQLAWLEGQLPVRTANGISLRQRGKIQLDAKIPKTVLSEHLDRIPEPLRSSLRAKLHDAEASFSLHLEGSARNPRGHVSVQASAQSAAEPETTVAVALETSIESPREGTLLIRPTGSLTHSKLQTPLVVLSGSTTIAIDLKQPKNSDVALDLTLDLGTRALASLAPLANEHEAKVQALVGDLAGTIHLGGTSKSPSLEARLAVGAANPLKLSVDAQRVGNEVSLNVETAVTELLLSELWPAFLPPLIDDPLVLSSDLGVRATVLLGSAPTLENLALRGSTNISGAAIAVPTSTRVWRDVALALVGKGKVLSVEASAHESDEQQADRTLKLTAKAAVDLGEKPKLVDLSARLKTKEWLLFGGILGKPDGPRATVDADVEVTADLTGALPLVDVTVHSARYWEPDREVFTHGFEDLAPTGDVNFVGDSEHPVGVVGPRLAELQPATASPEAAAPEAAAPEAKLIVRVHIPEPVAVAKGPLRLKVRGEIEQRVPSLGPSGTLEIDGGHMVFFGHEFPYVASEIALNGGPPAVKLSFADGIAPDLLRQVSRASGGTKTQIHLLPVGGGPLISFAGPGNRSMVEMLSFLHTGHGYVLSPPDAPASLNIRAPQGMHPTMIAFIKANIPRLDLLDRFAVWSNAFDMHTSYGQLRNLDGTRFIGNGSRLRLISRPQQIGRSTNEVHLDRVLLDSTSMSLGVGLRGGTRLGGGIGAFFEWTSGD